jgi:hypothetical protein
VTGVRSARGHRCSLGDDVDLRPEDGDERQQANPGDEPERESEDAVALARALEVD